MTEQPEDEMRTVLREGLRFLQQYERLVRKAVEDARADRSMSPALNTLTSWNARAASLVGERPSRQPEVHIDAKAPEDREGIETFFEEMIEITVGTGTHNEIGLAFRSYMISLLADSMVDNFEIRAKLKKLSAPYCP